MPILPTYFVQHTINKTQHDILATAGAVHVSSACSDHLLPHQVAPPQAQSIDLQLWGGQIKFAREKTGFVIRLSNGTCGGC